MPLTHEPCIRGETVMEGKKERKKEWGPKIPSQVPEILGTGPDAEESRTKLDLLWISIIPPQHRSLIRTEPNTCFRISSSTQTVALRHHKLQGRFCWTDEGSPPGLRSKFFRQRKSSGVNSYQFTRMPSSSASVMLLCCRALIRVFMTACDKK